MKIAQGEPYGYDFTVEGQDWTGYAGTATFKRSPEGGQRLRWWITGAEEPILTVDVTADATGVIQIGLTSAETALFPGAGPAGLLPAGGLSGDDDQRG